MVVLAAAVAMSPCLEKLTLTITWNYIIQIINNYIFHAISRHMML